MHKITRTRKLVFNQMVADLGLVSSILLLIIAWATTNTQSYVILSGIRNFVIFPILILCIAASWLDLFKPLAARAFFTWAFLVALMLFNTTLIGNVYINFPALVAFYLLPLMFTLFLQKSRNEIITDRSLFLLLLSIFLIFFLTLFVGGVSRTIPPVFLFEAQIFGSENDLTYSLGSSRVYGLGALISALLATKSSMGFKKIFLYSSMVFLFWLSFIAGGRGEILITAAMILLCHGLGRGVIIVSSCMIIYSIAPDLITLASLDEYPVIERFLALKNSYGMRDELLAKSLELLSNEPRCLLLGCGFSYFQQYFGLEMGLYPHNVLIETVIAAGLPLTMILVVLVISKSFILGNSNQAKNFLFFMLFFFLVSLKSGELLTSWPLIGCGIFVLAFRDPMRGSWHRPQYLIRHF